MTKRTRVKFGEKLGYIIGWDNSTMYNYLFQADEIHQMLHSGYVPCNLFPNSVKDEKHRYWWVNLDQVEIIEEADFKYGDFICQDCFEDIKYAYIGKTPNGNLITYSEPSKPIPASGVFQSFIWGKINGDNSDWHLYEEPKKSAVVELTLSEIADKIGINVNDLRIKEEK